MSSDVLSLTCPCVNYLNNQWTGTQCFSLFYLRETTFCWIYKIIFKNLIYSHSLHTFYPAKNNKIFVIVIHCKNNFQFNNNLIVLQATPLFLFSNWNVFQYQYFKKSVVKTKLLQNGISLNIEFWKIFSFVQ